METQKQNEKKKKNRAMENKRTNVKKADMSKKERAYVYRAIIKIRYA